MKVPVAYGAVVLIWSTTPLAIQLSSGDFGFIGALAWRMALGVVLAYCSLRWFSKGLNVITHWRSYLFGSLGMFPTMGLVYWAAQVVPSGVISIVFAANPFLVGMLSYWLLHQERLTPLKIVGMLCAFAGLIVIFYDQLQVDPGAGQGVLVLLLANVIFSLSSVGLKRWGSGALPMQQATGSMLFALPGIVLAWLLFDGTPPHWHLSVSLGAMIYLAVMGSVVGFALYFFLLTELSATSVALIGMMTPALALCLGALVAGDALTPKLIAGTALVVIGLLFYQGQLRSLLKRNLDA